MSAVDKILKKAEQERRKGNDDKALERLKEALAREPRQYPYARAAALICFETGRTIEGVSILRAAMKRVPSERPDALELAREEFQQGHQLEIAELLYDAYLAEPDYDQARAIVEDLTDSDAEKLLHKLQSKLSALREDAPENKRRMAGMLLAQAVALSAMKRPVDAAACFDRVLEADPNITETIGRLCKEELQRSRRCSAVRVVLGRCYLRIKDYERAAEQFLKTSQDPGCRARTLHLLGDAPKNRTLRELRAYLLLLEKQFDAAQETLESLLDGTPDSETSVRRVLEQVPDVAHATPGLAQLFARVLASTQASGRALRELEVHREKGGNAASSLVVVDEILEKNPNDVDALQLRARLYLDMRGWAEAAQDFQRVLAGDPTRARALKQELEGVWQPSPELAPIGALLVHIYVQIESPREAADILSTVYETGGSTPAVLFELASVIAGRYGFTSEILAVFVQSALELHRESDARAAIQHYYASPGARVAEFTQRVEAILTARPELGEPLARVFEGIQVPLSLHMLLVRCRLFGDNPVAALADLAALAANHPDSRPASLDVLESFLRQCGEVPEALELAAELHLDTGQLTQAAELFARAVSADPNAAERVCRRADRMLTQAAAFDEVWRPLILALVDTQCYRFARDLCYRAAQAVPAERQGFLHAALGACQVDAGQVAAASEAYENALACQDVDFARVFAGLHQALELDAQHGHTHYVLARAMLRAGEDTPGAIDELQEAVRLDQMLADHALETLQEHRGAVDDNATALALEGSLRLRKGESERGVQLLDRALAVAPDVAPAVLQSLQLEWDRNGDNVETGLALSRALVECDQERRAARLLTDMARRFEKHQPRILQELERLLTRTSLPEAHRALWEIHLRNGNREAALKQVRLALEAAAGDVDAQRELLETAHRKMGDETWVTCQLAQLEIQADNDGRAEQLLRGLLENDLGARDDVLATLSAARIERSERLCILEVDALIAGESWEKAHAAVARLRKRHPDASDEALKRLRVLVSRGNTQMGAELDLALLMQEKGEIEEAVRVLETALRVGEAARLDSGEYERDTDSGATVDGSWQESDSGSSIEDPSQPAAQIDEEARSSPKATEARLLLASFYVDLGRVREGKELLENVLQGGPSSERAYEFLKRISSDALRAKLKQLQDSIDRTPGDLRARLELGRLSLLSGDFQGAREALGFPADSPTMEATRRYLLARTYADEDRPHLAAAVLRAIDLSDVSEAELRRNVLYLQARCAELLGRFAEAHATYLRIVSEFPEFKDAQEKARATYRKHLETGLETRALVLEKRTGLELEP